MYYQQNIRKGCPGSTSLYKDKVSPISSLKEPQKSNYLGSRLLCTPYLLLVYFSALFALNILSFTISPIGGLDFLLSHCRPARLFVENSPTSSRRNKSLKISSNPRCPLPQVRPAHVRIFKANEKSTKRGICVALVPLTPDTHHSAILEPRAPRYPNAKSTLGTSGVC